MVTDMHHSVAEDVRAIGRIDAVPAILQIVSEITGLRFAAVARVTEDSWTCCAVLDKIDFGLKVGGELDVSTTLCREIRASRDPIIIEKASEDVVYCGHPTPRKYGFESYIAVPIVRRSGEVFGTICALDPRPAKLRDGKILLMVKLYAELISAQLEVEERLSESQTELANEIETGALREQFIAVLGHDLRNPLSSIVAGTRLLARRPTDEKDSFVLRQMEQSCTRMSRLIDDVLDFARGRLGGGIRIQRRDVTNLADDLSAVIAELQRVHPDRLIETALDIRGAVTCDPDRLAQLFSNLLGNGLAYGAADKPVKVVACNGAAGFLLSVTNQGPVIPRETIAQLFKPYTRPAQGVPQAGLGLGLYIASEIARSHGGAITVASTEEDGTTFTFVMPPRR
jgi:phosphoserine phosphatase RsbU/P